MKFTILITTLSKSTFFNLWKWKDVIHKNFIISATYNEASKVVIEYLAELTDKKIKIIESERVRFPEKQSNLFLHYSPAPNFSSSTPEIKNLIERLINRDKEIDILCSTKSLAEDIFNPTGELGKFIRKKYQENVKNCTSKLINNQRQENEEPTNQYDENSCNIGTNFKTGVNITKENHAFVVILPSAFSKNPFKNQSGIFSGGINSIIQALARQRKAGEIHIVLPKPDEFDFNSLEQTSMSDKQKRYFINVYEKIKPTKKKTHHFKKAFYIPFNQQDSLLYNFFFNDKYGDVKQEIQHIEELDRTGMPPLVYPDYKTFKLERGENYLADTVKIFGKDLSSFMTYSAIANQFINCRLEEINTKPYLFFNDIDIKEQYRNYFHLYFTTKPKHDIDSYYELLIGTCNFKKFYEIVRHFFFYELDIYQSTLKKKKNPEDEDEYNHIRITPLNKKYKDYEIALLELSAELYYSNSYEHQLIKNSTTKRYTIANYFLDNINQSRYLNPENLTAKAQKKFRFYQLLDELRQAVINEIEDYDGNADNSFKYLLKVPSKTFLSKRNVKKYKEFKTLMHSDVFIANDIFHFRRKFEKIRKSVDGLKVLYKFMLSEFFELEDKKVTINRRKTVSKVNLIKPLPNSTYIINTISEPDYRAEYLDALIEYTGKSKQQIEEESTEFIQLLETE